MVLIHFPIALFLAGVLFDFLGQWTRRRTLTLVAYYDFLLSGISAIPAVITGIVAWRWALEGQRLKSVLLMHLVFGGLSSLLIWAVWLIHKNTGRLEGKALTGYRLPIEAAAAAMVAITGHLGGILSGVNGPG